MGTSGSNAHARGAQVTVTSDLGSNMAYRDTEVETLRGILQKYDEGTLTSGEVWGQVYTLVLRDCVTHLKEGETTFTFGSEMMDETKEIVQAQIEFGPSTFTVRPLECPTEPTPHP